MLWHGKSSIEDVRNDEACTLGTRFDEGHEGDEMHMMMKMMKMMMMKKMMKKMMMSMHEGPMDMMESAGSARDMDDDDEGVDISAILRLVGANANGARRPRRDAALFELE